MYSLIKYTKCLLFSIAIISELSEVYTFRKCCESDEALELIQNTYYCSLNLHKYVKPLTINNSVDLEIGIPEFCGSDSCVDKTIDGREIIELSCDQKVKNSSVKLPTIFKCCPWNMDYDASTKSCIPTNSSLYTSIFDTNSTVYNIKFGAPICPSTSALVDDIYEGNFTINNGVLTLDNLEEFENGTYCIDKSHDRGEIHIQSCKYKMDVCRNMTCIPKCCPFGQKYVKRKSNIKTQCEEDFSLPFLPNSVEGNIDMPENIALLPSKDCRKYKAESYHVNENGTLFLKSFSFDGIDQTYCVEYMEAPKVKGFIALICLPQTKPTGQHNFYYLAGLLVSIIFLAITLTIYFFLPELQNLHGRTLMSHSASLLASYIFLAMVKKPITAYDKSTCLILAFGIMYTFLVSFAWLNVMCFDIWYTFGVVRARGMKKKTDLKKFLLYSLYAYGVPLIIISITLYVDRFSDVPDKFRPKFGEQSCWFDLRSVESHWPYTIFFGIPVGLILVFNLILFILTVRYCLKVRNDIQTMQHADSPKKRRFFTDRATLVMNLKLFIVMGISWIFEVISMYVREPFWVWYILDILNVLQGLWIFFIFVLKDNVWKALKKKLGYQVVREGSQTQSTAYSTKNSLASSTSLKANGVIRPEERDLLQTAVRNSASSAFNDRN